MSDDVLVLSDAAFAAKAAARKAVWRLLRVSRVARFPFPTEGRIPNFAGAAAAAERALDHPLLKNARRIKVNPDSPQRPLRRAALERGIQLLVPTPRLTDDFWLLDPAEIPPESYRQAATATGAKHWGRRVPIAELPALDAIVVGSVAVTAEGKRAGKGHGYADLEQAILAEMGIELPPVITTVHDLQVVRDIPRSEHDTPLAAIFTPTRTFEVAQPFPNPRGIDWQQLTAKRLEEMPILYRLRPPDFDESCQP